MMFGAVQTLPLWRLLMLPETVLRLWQDERASLRSGSAGAGIGEDDRNEAESRGFHVRLPVMDFKGN